MDTILQALVMGVLQGLTEFLPVSSSGHLILVPAILGWDDPFLESLAFSVMLHISTLAAILVYFWRDWLRLVPAGLALLRDRSTRGDPDRRVALLLLVATIPAAVAGVAFNDVIERSVRQPGLVALMLVVGAAILWLAERWGSQLRPMERLGAGAALGIGCAQALALVPGISRSGISISAGLFAGLDRPSAARFSFLMLAPITAGAGVFEARQLLTGEAGVPAEIGPLIVGMLGALVAGLAAIHVLLGYLRTHTTDVFVAYRLALAALVVVVLLSR